MAKELSESEAFVLLAKRRRRLLIRILQEAPTPITAAELAKRIGYREWEDPSPQAFRSIYLTLYHNHLPKLREADVVEYDEDEGTVHPGINFDVLFPILKTADERGLSWTGENSC